MELAPILLLLVGAALAVIGVKFFNSRNAGNSSTNLVKPLEVKLEEQHKETEQAKEQYEVSKKTFFERFSKYIRK